jgi:glycosyltransferase involved in cell wall biosynthesis
MRILSPEMWKKIDVVALGVDPSIYIPQVFIETPSLFEILCVGRLTISKGQEILIHSVVKILKLGKNVRLRLVGDGPDRSRLEECVNSLGCQKSIIFEGALNVEKTLEAYKLTHIFALTSFAEGLPVVLMEAMSMEIPCVATSINGIPELIKNEGNGLLVNCSNIEETTKALLRLLDDSSLRLKLGKAGRQTIQEKYNLNENVKYLKRCFENRFFK